MSGYQINQSYWKPDILILYVCFMNIIKEDNVYPFFKFTKLIKHQKKSFKCNIKLDGEWVPEPVSRFKIWV